MIALCGDVTQAFSHASIDQPVAMAIPMEPDGLILNNNNQTIKLIGGSPVIIHRALYGYKRSPRLWQRWLSDNLMDLKLKRSQVDPTTFYYFLGVSNYCSMLTT